MGANEATMKFLLFAAALIATASAYSSGYASGYSSGQVAKTIVQKITFGGTQSEYTGNVKTCCENAYGLSLNIWTSSGYATGCGVASVASASRRAYAVTFTATASAAKSYGATQYATALASDVSTFANSINTVKATVTAFNSLSISTPTGAAAATSSNVAGAASTAITSAFALVAVALALRH